MAFWEAAKAGWAAMMGGGSTAAMRTAASWTGRGAAIGAAWGGFQGWRNDTGIVSGAMGGAFGGAILGGAAGAFAPTARAAWRGGIVGMKGAKEGVWAGARGFFGGAGQAGWTRMQREGMVSAAHIGKNITKGFNEFKALV